MRASACDRFRDRLDRDPAGAGSDPHPAACPACARALGAARSVQAMLRRTGAAAAAGALAPFASRVAYLAWAERQERGWRRRARRGLPIPVPPWQPAAVVLLSCAVLVLPRILGSFGAAGPDLAGLQGLPLDVYSRALSPLIGTGLLVLASMWLARRAA